MADAVGAEPVEGVDDARRPQPLPGVDRDSEPGRARAGKAAIKKARAKRSKIG